MTICCRVLFNHFDRSVQTHQRVNTHKRTTTILARYVAGLAYINPFSGFQRCSGNDYCEHFCERFRLRFDERFSCVCLPCNVHRPECIRDMGFICVIRLAQLCVSCIGRITLQPRTTNTHQTHVVRRRQINQTHCSTQAERRRQMSLCICSGEY